MLLTERSLQLQVLSLFLHNLKSLFTKGGGKRREALSAPEFNLQVWLQLVINSQMYLLFELFYSNVFHHVGATWWPCKEQVILSSNTQPTNKIFMNHLTGSAVTFITSNNQQASRSLSDNCKSFLWVILIHSTHTDIPHVERKSQ